MSWKIRRAHYYARKSSGGQDPEVAKWINLIFLISLIFSFILLVLANGGADTDNPVVAILSLFGLISLITTPILFLFFLGGIQHGLPNFAKSTKTIGEIPKKSQKKVEEELARRRARLVEKTEQNKLQEKRKKYRYITTKERKRYRQYFE